MDSKILKWQKKVVIEETHSSCHYLLDYATENDDFASLMMLDRWAIKAILPEGMTPPYGISTGTAKDMSMLDEMSFGVVTAWNGLPEEKYMSKEDALKSFHKLLVSNGSVFLALRSAEYDKKQVEEMVKSAGFGIDSIFAKPETGVLSVVTNLLTKNNPEKAKEIVYHLRKSDTLNFHL